MINGDNEGLMVQENVRIPRLLNLCGSKKNENYAVKLKLLH